MSFEDIRNALVVAYANDSLDDEELLILCDFYFFIFFSIHSSVSKSSSRTGFLKYPISGN